MATTQKGIYYPDNYEAVADVPEDMQTMAESIDTAIENSEESTSQALANKVDKVTGKGLSTNDYDNTEQGKVEANTEARHTHSNKSVLDNTTASYTAEEKTKLEGIETGATRVIVDDTLSNSSTNAIQNKKVKEALDEKVDKIEGKGLSTEDYTTAEKTQLAENTSDISALEEENADLKEQLSDLQKNTKKETTELFEETEINNSADSRIYSLDAFQGNTEQETTTGANLQKFNPRTSSANGTTYTCDEKGQVTITGTGSSYTGYSYNLQNSDSMTLSEGTYILKVIGTISSDTNIRLNGVTGITLNSNQEYTFTLSEDTSDFYVLIGVNAGTHNDNFYITLAAGTTATTERYTNGASPNPSYPQEIRNCGDNVNLSSEDEVTLTGPVNKKLCDFGDGRTFEKISFTIIADNATYSAQTSALFRYINQNDTEIYIGLNDLKATGSSLSGTYTYTLKNVTIKTITLLNWSVIKGTIKIKIEEGEPTEYSKSGCGSINEKIENKNLVDLPNPLSVTTQTEYIPCKILAGTHEISCSKVETTGTTSYYLIQVQYEDNTSGYFQMYKQTLKTTITTNKVVKNIKFYSQDGYQSSVGITTVYYDFMIEEGSTATSYVPHQEQTLPFPLQEGQVMAEGDYLADDGIHHVMGEHIFTGTEDFSKSSGYTTTASFCCYTMSISPAPKRNSTLGKLNIGRVTNHAGMTNYNTCFGYNTNDNHFLKIQKTAIPNWDESLTDTEKVTLFKSYLAQQYTNGTPIKLEYELATEVIDPYTSEQQEAYNNLKKTRTYKDKTYWTSLDTVPSKKQITYYQDQTSIIDDLITRVELLESEV